MISPDRLIVMLMTDADLYGRFGVSSSAGWRDLVRQAPTTRERVTGSEQWGPKLFSAISQRLRRMEHQAPCLAVGDAALAVDPVSGSGVVRALHSAQSCAETTLALLESGSPSLTEAYEAARDGECTSYLQERALYYGLEQRWQGSPFWQRRASAVEYAAHTAV